ncbi:MAG: GTPase domain-containing protein [Xenococcus sp. MO_188.B8]|nr:GTPase domain-containing protein [Xenococcus sp. MO_188.B8]
MFADKPDLLEANSLENLESEVLIRKLREQNKLFTTPINIYVTGRTGAGKTTLGNSLLDSNQAAMRTDGRQDCTNSLQLFRLVSNFLFFDLPGSGSNEKFENINRAILLLSQIEDIEFDIPRIKEFQILDYSNYCQTKKVKKNCITVQEWQSPTNQQHVAPDLILYLVAPQMQFLRLDKKYLRELLKSQQTKNRNSKVIFVLNTFYREGQALYTEQNFEDVRKQITEIYQNYYSSNPAIFEVNCLTGSGFKEIIQYINKILPKEKLGGIEQLLSNDLRELAEKERDRLYQHNLIQFVSRVVRHSVGLKLGNKDLLWEAASAIKKFGFATYKSKAIVTNFDSVINGRVNKIKKLRTNQIKVEKVKSKTKKFNNYTIKKECVMKKKDIWLGKFIWKDIVTKKRSFKCEVVTGKKNKIVYTEFLKAGYPTILFLLGLGLGVKNFFSHCEEWEIILQKSEEIVEKKLAPFKTQIKQLVESINPYAERDLSILIQKALLK